MEHLANQQTRCCQEHCTAGVLTHTSQGRLHQFHVDAIKQCNETRVSKFALHVESHGLCGIYQNLKIVDKPPKSMFNFEGISSNRHAFMLNSQLTRQMQS